MVVRVVKCGGSLLDLPNLAQRLKDWLARQSNVCHLLVVGGGGLADQLRRIDRRHHLDQAFIDQLAVETMYLNARLARRLLGNIPWLHSSNDRAAERRAASASFVMFDPRQFLDPSWAAPGQTSRPVGWTVTSDSLAAIVASRYQLAELVLLKSALPGPCQKVTRAEAAEWGYVDPYFPTASEGLPRVRAVSFPTADFPEVELRPRP